MASSRSVDIRPIVVPDDRKTKSLHKLRGKVPDWAFMPHFNLIMLAPRNSGKSTLIFHLLYQAYLEVFDEVHVFSTTLDSDPIWTAAGRVHKHHGYKDSEVRRIVQSQVGHCEPDSTEQRHLLLIFDDLLGAIKPNSEVCKLITRSRHYNISMIMTTQGAKGLAPIIRENCTSIIALNNTSEESLRRMDDVLDDRFMNMMRALKNDPEASRFNFVLWDRDRSRYSYNFDDLILEKE